MTLYWRNTYCHQRAVTVYAKEKKFVMFHPKMHQPLFVKCKKKINVILILFNKSWLFVCLNKDFLSSAVTIAEKNALLWYFTSTASQARLRPWRPIIQKRAKRENRCTSYMFSDLLCCLIVCFVFYIVCRQKDSSSFPSKLVMLFFLFYVTAFFFLLYPLFFKESHYILHLHMWRWGVASGGIVSARKCQVQNKRGLAANAR